MTREARLHRIALGGALMAVALGMVLGNPAAVLVREDREQAVDAVFVFSGDADFHRTRYAAAVFRRLGARWFVVSGEGAGGDSGPLMGEAAKGFGVPGEALVVESRARTTRENVLFSAPLLAEHSVRRVAVVTSRFHSRRAALTAEHAWPGIEVISLPVTETDPRECPVRGWEQMPGCSQALRSEWEKLLGYLLRGWL